MVYGKKDSLTAEDDFDVFYQKWRSPIRRSLALALGEVALADEAVDEAMARAVARWDKVKDYERPEGWLYRVGLNWARGVFRKRRYELLSELNAFEQVAPLTEMEIAAILEPFLQARIDGEGAEAYLGDPDIQHEETGFLYTTSTGAPYERAEFEIEEGEMEQQGPLGFAIGVRVRLFADGGQTVVEQTFSLEQDMPSRSWALFHHEGNQSTENGVPLPRP